MKYGDDPQFDQYLIRNNFHYDIKVTLDKKYPPHQEEAYQSLCTFLKTYVRTYLGRVDIGNTIYAKAVEYLRLILPTVEIDPYIKIDVATLGVISLVVSVDSPADGEGEK